MADEELTGLAKSNPQLLALSETMLDYKFTAEEQMFCMRMMGRLLGTPMLDESPYYLGIGGSGPSADNDDLFSLESHDDDLPPLESGQSIADDLPDLICAWCESTQPRCPCSGG